MGVYLKDATPQFVSSPINVAKSLIDRDRSEFADDPDIIDGQETSQSELDGRTKFVVAQQGNFRSIFFPGGTPVSNEHWDVVVSGSDIILTAKGSWIGNVISVEQGGNLNFQTLPDVTNGYTVQFPLSSRRALFYTLEGGTPVDVSVSAPDVTIPDNSGWITVSTWEAPESTTVSASGQITGGSGIFGDVYMRFVVETSAAGHEVRHALTGANKTFKGTLGGASLTVGQSLKLQVRKSLSGDSMPLTGVGMNISYITQQ